MRSDFWKGCDPGMRYCHRIRSAKYSYSSNGRLPQFNPKTSENLLLIGSFASTKTVCTWYYSNDVRRAHLSIKFCECSCWQPHIIRSYQPQIVALYQKVAFVSVGSHLLYILLWTWEWKKWNLSSLVVICSSLDFRGTPFSKQMQWTQNIYGQAGTSLGRSIDRVPESVVV